ncbi:MAG TPA: aromatic ring-hydroxylating dioxygenase subunit alpha [Longimicrobiales bacterium]|nr:aromatic ring-hydroxylating dioxygenase subunit alpha [Longimicrobiales bacterium]
MRPRPAFTIDPDIRRAGTLPGWMYARPDVFEDQRERVFARTWHWLADSARLRAPGHALPVTHVEGALDEPLVLIRAEDGSLRCLSNVCTHRGAVVVEGEGHVKGLRCRYHGRRFDLGGRCTSMPEFDDVVGFPAESDHLPSVPVTEWGPLVFGALDPAMSFEDWIAPVTERTAGLPVERAVYDPSSSGDYLIEANWALYCDNFLEEFHIPYVHGGSLTGALDYEAYRTELFDWGNLQVGAAKEGQPVLDLAPGSPDHGQRVAGYYFWLFPATMLNFYPWGLSLNVVRPLAPSRTRVSFRSYVWDHGMRGQGPGGDLHRVEMEDEEIVESVQRGVRSRLYQRGRYSPRREVGTHHFHGLLSRFLSG